MIQNPILRGFCPDPSIIRAGNDYYIATSTFEWWPGVKLFHSTDLKNWEQIPSPLRRESQLNMIGDPTSGGVWAPCLSFDGTYFYLVYTDVKTKKGRYYNTHNYMVYTDDIRGEWSEPVYLNSIGFDPSLFHDTDGRKYLINMVNGFKGVLVQEIDPKTWKLVGERKKVYAGSGIGCTEGPHMYHIGDWYYLLVAEGGTGYDHCVTMARSRSIWGPFETAPNNPILTSDKDDMTALQKSGHADFTDTPDGEWYMVHLCSRPLNGMKWCTLGRETAIQKMQWSEDGWLEMAAGGKFAQMETEEASGVITTVEVKPGSVKDIHEEFECEELPVGFVSPRTSWEKYTDLKTRPGWLRLIGHESMNSLHRVSMVAQRQQEAHVFAETVVDFDPEYPEQLGGLTYMYDAMNFYIFGITSAEDNGGRLFTIVKSDAGIVTDEISPIRLEKDGAVMLRADILDNGAAVQFSYRFSEEEEWIAAGGKYSTEIVTDEHCRGFTGAHFGLYVHDMTGLGFPADFDCFHIVYSEV